MTTENPKQATRSAAITGAEYREFIKSTDTRFWPEGAHIDEVLIMVNGAELQDPDEDTMPDNAVIKIRSGFVVYEDYSTKPLLSVFKQWRAAQSFDTMLVELPKEKGEEFRALVAALGGKIK